MVDQTKEAMGYGQLIVDNVIGLDNDYDSVGEKLGRAFKEDKVGFLKTAASGVYEGAKEFVTSPIDSTKEISSISIFVPDPLNSAPVADPSSSLKSKTTSLIVPVQSGSFILSVYVINSVVPVLMGVVTLPLGNKIRRKVGPPVSTRILMTTYLFKLASTFALACSNFGLFWPVVVSTTLLELKEWSILIVSQPFNEWLLKTQF